MKNIFKTTTIFALAAALFLGPIVTFAAASATVAATTFTTTSATITGGVGGVTSTSGIVFRYSLKSSSDWTDIAPISWSGFNFTVTMNGLKAGASYEYGLRLEDGKTDADIIKNTFDFTGAPSPQESTSKPGDISINIPLDNPLGDTNSIPVFIAKALDAAVALLTPVVVIMMIYAGFLFVTAQGSAEKLGPAKKALLYTLIGAAVVLGAKGLAIFVQGTITCLAGGGAC